VILITSGAYISPELEVEIGCLPSAFVPLGNKRLYEHQSKILRETFTHEPIFISLPDTYQISNADRINIQKLELNIILVPVGLTLGSSLIYAIDKMGCIGKTLRILHGDTYLESIPTAIDIVLLAELEDPYSWEIEQKNEQSVNGWCGFFAFADSSLLKHSLQISHGDFVKGIRIYSQYLPLHYPISESWFDLGHVNTYFRSRAKVTTARSFNEIKICNGTVFKASTHADKIRAEAAWLMTLPPHLKRYAPQLIQFHENTEKPGYEIEYLPNLPLSELFVHCNLSPVFWRKIFKLVRNFIDDCYEPADYADAKRNEIEFNFQTLVINKTQERTERYLKDTNDDRYRETRLNGQMLPSLDTIIRECQTATLYRTPKRPGISHGDFCFSNILYDSRLNIIRVVDPRAMTADSLPSLYGDLRYDIAKFVHSIIGCYDHIIAGRYTLKEIAPLEFEFYIHIDENTASLQNNFLQHVAFLEISTRDILPLVILLFLSMLPLHNDAPFHQRAFLANALRCYQIWKS